jgi:hypothetical protein
MIKKRKSYACQSHRYDEKGKACKKLKRRAEEKNLSFICATSNFILDI